VRKDFSECPEGLEKSPAAHKASACFRALQTTEDQPAKLVRVDLAGARIKVGLVFGSGRTGSSALLDLYDERLLLWSHGSFHFFFVEPA